MNKLFFRTLALICIICSTYKVQWAQDTTSARTLSRLLLENQWLNTNNIAGIAFNPYMSDGNFILRYGSKDGDLKYARSYSEEQSYSFNAQKAVRLNKMTFKGGIEYENLIQQGDTIWTARMDNLTRNPYILGDTTVGENKKDYITLNGGFAYQVNQKISAGIDINYMVGDGAKIKDPRPQSKLYKLEVQPGLIYSFKKAKIGVSGQYFMGREKIKYETVKEYETHHFYYTFGLGQSVRHKGSYLIRNYYLKGFGGDLQFQYLMGKTKLFAGIGYLNQTEEAEDGSSKIEKRDAGDYQEDILHLFVMMNFNTRFLHSIKLGMDYCMGTGVEFLQEPYSLDGETYYRTIAELEKYTLDEFTIGLQYNLAKPHNAYSNKWEFMLSSRKNNLSSEYLLEAQQEYTNWVNRVQFNKYYYKDKNQFSFSVNGMSSYNLSGELKQLKPYEEEDFITWHRVTYPDYLLNTSTIFGGGLNLRYGRNVNIIEGRRNMAYIDFGFNIFAGDNSQWKDNKTFETYSIKLGITY